MTNSLTPETIVYDLATAGDPQISPDGKSLLFTRSQADRTAAQTRSQIWISSPDGTNQRLLTSSGNRNLTPRWSPDGSQIAFVSDRLDRNAIFLLPANGGEAVELTRHLYPISALVWSLDGASIAYSTSFNPENPDEVPPLPDSAPPVRVVRRVDYKQDNRGYLNDLRQQVWLIDVASGSKRMVTSDLVDHEFPQWSPDGKSIAVRIPIRNGMHSQLGLIDVASGEPTRFGPASGMVGCWSWSPDGSHILFTGDTEQSWQQDFFLLDVGAGTIRRLTEDLAVQPDSGFPTVSGPSQPVWIDSQTVLFHAQRGGSSGIYQIDTSTGAVELLYDWHGQNVGLSNDGRYFYQSGGSLGSAGHLVRFDRQTGAGSTIVEPNRELLADTPAAEFESFTVDRGGYTIEAWLLKPPGFDPALRYPLVLDIHGGPNSWYGPGFSPIQQALAGAGFLVAFSNPRGSGSYGRSFTQQVIHDWGGEDYLDLMAVVDSVLERPYADPDRTGIYGYSYGGFMSSWIIGHTDRFKAAVIGAPVVDLVSFYGTADIGHTFGPMQIGGTPASNLEEYGFRSPIAYLHNVKTPVLIVHGEQDDRVPIGQGEQLFTTLHEQGCEVEFVRYPGGSHVSVTRTGPPAHRLDYLQRITAWFERFLQ